MKKETLNKANFLVRQAKATENLLERMGSGETMAIAYLSNSNNKKTAENFDIDYMDVEDFIHTQFENAP